MPSSSNDKPILRQFANLWTLEKQPSSAREWSLDEKFKRAKQAGFDAMGGGVVPDAAALCQKHGLEYICYIDGQARTFAERLEAAQKTKPARVNVQLGDHDTPPQEAVQVWIKMEAQAKKMGLEVDLEVHRDTSTETPEKVYEIAALYQKATGNPIRFCWDFSHLAVIKHLMPASYAERLLIRPDLIQIARQFHFRPFNGHHCQIPALDAKGRETAEIVPYFKFLDALIALWLKGAKGGEVLYVCPEMGPVESTYGLSTFPNVWKDACYLRGKIEALWQKNLRGWKPSRR